MDMMAPMISKHNITSQTYFKDLNYDFAAWWRPKTELGDSL